MSQSEPIYYIYAYLRKNGSPYYIGKGKGNRAWNSHSSCNCTTPQDKSRIIIMESNLTEIGAFALERFYIRWYGKKCDGTGILKNVQDGGEGNQLTENTKKKISLSKKGKRLTDEHKRKVSQSLLGNKRYLARKFSDESIEKIRQSSLNRKHTLETREKMRRSSLGKSGTITGKKWYHNPETHEERYFSLGQEITGFIQGRLKNVAK